MSDLKSALETAIIAHKNDINKFVWKTSGGKTVRLLDMNEQELQKAYNHCHDMLYNKSRYTPGKVVLRDSLGTMGMACVTELFVRFLLHECDIESIKSKQDLLMIVNNAKKDADVKNDDTIDVIFSNIGDEYSRIRVKDLIDACLGSLGSFNTKLITPGFLLAQGVWFTPEEMEDLTEYDCEGNRRSYFEVMKERLFMKDVSLRRDPKGFSYAEFRALVMLEKKNRISDLPTFTLKLIKDKVIYMLENELSYHIEKWMDLIRQIEMIAEHKNVELKKKEY